MRWSGRWGFEGRSGWPEIAPPDDRCGPSVGLALSTFCSLSPSRLRSQNNAGGSLSGHPSLIRERGWHAGGEGVGGCPRSVRVFRHFVELRTAANAPGEKVERRDICRSAAASSSLTTTDSTERPASISRRGRDVLSRPSRRRSPHPSAEETRAEISGEDGIRTRGPAFDRSRL